MTKEVLLHIGMHKTGSSSIQASLRNYKDDTTFFASNPEVNYSNSITTLFSDNPYEYHVWKKNGLSKEDVDAKKKRYLNFLTRAVENPKIQRLIISGEQIGTLPESGKKSLIEFFTSRGIDVKVICFIRSPSDFARSSSQQTIKGGKGSISYINPHYITRLKTFSDLLPKENLIVKDFTQVVGEYGDIVKGFAAICGLDHSRYTSERVNESLSASATKLLYQVNKLPLATTGTRERASARRQLVRILTKAFPATSEDKLDANILSGLVHPDLDDELKFLSQTFQIDFRDVAYASDLAASEKYLSDLTSLDEKRLVALLKEHQIQTISGDSVKLMLVALFNKISTGNPLHQSDAKYLREIAEKIETGTAPDLADSISLMSLALRARPHGPKIREKLTTYAEKLKAQSS